MLWFRSWNCRGFPWNKGPKLSWILNEFDILLPVETWENKESKVPTQMDLYYGQFGTSDPTIAEFGV